jgi:uncharacterized protein YcbK (DUF882 family)
MAFSSRTMKPDDWKKLEWFEPDAFKHPEKMGYEFMVWLDSVREEAGVPIVITSSYRDRAYNKSVGGAADSAHVDVPCNSVDIGMRPRPSDPNWNYSRFAIVQAALRLGCQRIGTYANGSLHLDRTEDKRPAPRMWRVVGAETP